MAYHDVSLGAEFGGGSLSVFAISTDATATLETSGSLNSKAFSLNNALVSIFCTSGVTAISSLIEICTVVSNIFFVMVLPTYSFLNCFTNLIGLSFFLQKSWAWW